LTAGCAQCSPPSLTAFSPWHVGFRLWLL
jgi:hypothetical protein